MPSDCWRNSNQRFAVRTLKTLQQLIVFHHSASTPVTARAGSHEDQRKGHCQVILACVRCGRLHGKVCDFKLERQGVIAPFLHTGAFAPNVMKTGDQIRKYKRNNDF
jgi:hypothetical protein